MFLENLRPHEEAKGRGGTMGPEQRARLDVDPGYGSG